MKKLIIALMCCFYATSFAETLGVVCHDAKETVEIIMKKYSEQPILLMKNVDTEYVVFYNEKTKTWSQITIKGDVACLLGDGKGVKVINNGKGV